MDEVETELRDSLRPRVGMKRCSVTLEIMAGLAREPTHPQSLLQNFKPGIAGSLHDYFRSDFGSRRMRVASHIIIFFRKRKEYKGVTFDRLVTSRLCNIGNTAQ